MQKPAFEVWGKSYRKILLKLLHPFLAWHFGHFAHSPLILPWGVFAPLPCEQCQRGDRVMQPWFDFPWAVALQPSSCLEPSKLQVSLVPPCVTALKHLKKLFHALFHFSNQD